MYPTASFLQTSSHPWCLIPSMCHFPTPSQLSWADAVAWTVLKSFVLLSTSVLSYLSSLLQVINQWINFCSLQECLEHNLYCHDLTELSLDSARMFWGKKKRAVLLNIFFPLLAILTGFSAVLGVLNAQLLIPSTEGSSNKNQCFLIGFSA